MRPHQNSKLKMSNKSLKKSSKLTKMIAARVIRLSTSAMAKKRKRKMSKLLQQRNLCRLPQVSTHGV